MIEGSYFSPGTARAQPAQLAVVDGALMLRLSEDVAYRVKITSSTQPLAKLPRRLTLSDDGIFEAPFNADYKSIGLRTSSRMSRWEDAPQIAAACLGLTVIAAICLWIWGIPLAADLAAARTSTRLLRQMDANMLEALGDMASQRSQLPRDKQERLQALFALLAENTGREGSKPQLFIRSMRGVGPNAFALPGGTILLSDELVRKARSDDEVAGVLAHELGHVKHRHSLRQIYSTLGITTLASLIASGPGPLIEGAMTFGTGILNLSYSRDFEREADLYAAQRLQKIGMNPSAFVDLLERLEDAQGAHSSDWLSTHPQTKDRRENLRKHGAD